VVRDRNDVHRNVPRLRVALELIQHTQARVIGQIDVEHDGARAIGCRSHQALARRVRDDALESHFARDVAQDPGEVHIVLDDENDARLRRQAFAIVVDSHRPQRR
jgi:hypothetical protein